MLKYFYGFSFLFTRKKYRKKKLSKSNERRTTMKYGILLSSYATAITNLKGVLTTLGAAIGAVMLVYGGIKFAMAFRQMDQQGEHQAVYSIVAGGVLIGLAALVAALT